MPPIPNDPDQVRMSFAAHLEELRSRIWRSLILLVLLFIGGWAFLRPELEWAFLRPHLLAVHALQAKGIEITERLQVLAPAESVFFDVKVAMSFALVIGLPFLVWQLWQFIAAGLYPKERKAITRWIPLAIGFGVAGILFGYFLMIPLVLEFLYEMPNRDFMIPAYRLTDYFSLFLIFTVALTLVFQLPLILMGLGSAGLVKPSTLRHYRRHFILGALVVAAILTPPDPASQILLALPTIVLFEIGILLAAWRAPKAPESASSS